MYLWADRNYSTEHGASVILDLTVRLELSMCEDGSKLRHSEAQAEEFVILCPRV